MNWWLLAAGTAKGGSEENTEASTFRPGALDSLRCANYAQDIAGHRSRAQRGEEDGT